MPPPAVKTKFELLPPLVELAPMYHVVALYRVACAVVVDPRVNGVPKAPLRLNPVVKLLVVPAVNRTDPITVLVMLLKVLEPAIVNAPAPACRSVQLYMYDPPLNVFADAEVSSIYPVPVPAVVVKFVPPAVQAVPLLVACTTPPLNVRFRAVAPEPQLTVGEDNVNPARSKLPVDRLNPPVARVMVKLPASVYVLPELVPLIKMVLPGNATPALLRDAELGVTPVVYAKLRSATVVLTVMPVFSNKLP